MTQSITTKRIEYFDLMKGVCIALVIITHCAEEFELKLGGERFWSMLEHLRMPLYFFLSGMFFKEYSSFIDFVVRKFNKLVIPFAFFIFITVIPKLITGDVELGLIPIKKHFTWMIKYGGYLWFLRTLFFANILYYCYYKSVSNRPKSIQITVMLLLCTIGWIINSFIPIEGDYRKYHAYLTSTITSFLVLPLFFTASNLRPILSSLQKLKAWHLACIFITSLTIWYFSSHGGVFLINAKVQNNIILFYVAAFSGITCIWSICYVLKKVFFFTYLGRYSIIAYLTHPPILALLLHFYPQLGVFELIGVILLLMPPMIWLFKTTFPKFVAQKDLLTYTNGHLRISK